MRISQNPALQKLQDQLTKYKFVVNQDFDQLLTTIHALKAQTQSTKELAEFIKDFLAIPDVAFTVRQFSLCVNQLSHIIRQLVAGQVDVVVKKLCTHIITGLSSIAKALSISENDFAPEGTPRNAKKAISPQQNAAKNRREVLNLFLEQIGNVADPAQVKAFLKQAPESAAILTPKKVKKEPKKGKNEPEIPQNIPFDTDGSDQSASTIERFRCALMTAQDALNSHVGDLAKTFNELEGDARKQLALSPARFSIMSTPIERSLQNLTDLLELMDEDSTSANPSTSNNSSNSSINGRPDGEHLRQMAEFEEDNPFAFHLSHDDYVFPETQKQIFDETVVRPLFYSALAKANAVISSRRALLVLEIEGQLMVSLSIVLEQISKQMSLFDAAALTKVVELLCTLINLSAGYTYGDGAVFPGIDELAQRGISLKELVAKLRDPKNAALLPKQSAGLLCAFVDPQQVVISAAAAFLWGIVDVKKKFKAPKDFKARMEPFCMGVPCDPRSQPVWDVADTGIIDETDTALQRYYISQNGFYLTMQTTQLLVEKLTLIERFGTGSPGVFESEDQLQKTIQEQMRAVQITGGFWGRVQKCRAIQNRQYTELQQKLNTRVAEARQAAENASDTHSNEASTTSVIRLSSSVNDSRQGSRSQLAQTVVQKSETRKDFSLRAGMSLSDFIPLRLIASGGYGSVVLVLHKMLNVPLAIKIIRKEDMVRKNSVNRVKLEAQIYKTIEQTADDPALSRVRTRLRDVIVRFYGCFKTQAHVFMVLEYCGQGDLSNLLLQCGALGEAWSKQLIAEIAVGLASMHSCGLVYNDLKPANLLLTDDGHVKFTDFGVSQIAIKPPKQKQKANLNTSQCSAGTSSCDVSLEADNSQLNQGKKLFAALNQMEQDAHAPRQEDGSAPVSQRQSPQQQAVAGTPYYLAPELLVGESPSAASDYWALGIVLAEFLFGIRPFDAEDLQELFRMITDDEPNIPDDPEISDNARGLIRMLLVKNPKKRLQKIAEIRAHPFFANISWENIFRQHAVYVPEPIKLDKTPMFPEGSAKAANWVEELIQQHHNQSNGQTGSEPQSTQGGMTDEQFLDFSFTNQRLLYEENGILGPANQNSLSADD